MRRVAIVAAVLAAVAGIVVTAPARAAGPVIRESGYLAMADGVRLRYTVVRPSTGGPFPTLFEYSGYDPGTNPDAAYVQRFVEQDHGYAYVGVNIRGTGCSEGTFDFFQPQEAIDGAAVVDWITEQPWSNGRVGMIGKSYPGITQLFVAARRPPGLAAIAPGHFFADVYRDVARPGGIANVGFSSLWSLIGRPSYEFQSSPGQVRGGDAGCVRGSTQWATGLPTNPFVQLLEHPYDDALVRERSPITYLDDIDVPMLATLSWQDEQLGSRQTHLLAALDDLRATNWWATLTNGDHSMARTRVALDELEQFYDRFLRDEANGWDDRPRVRVWWESGRDGTRAPGWVSELDHWSEARRVDAGQLQAWPLHLGAGGRLTESPPADGAPSTTYVYTPGAGSQGVANPSYGYGPLPFAYAWDQAPPPGTAAAFTTDPFTADRTLLGSASLDLWLASAAAPEVDLQVTLTEVQPDGQEVYVQQGWLRASHRAEPAVPTPSTQSTPLRPYHTHQEGDVAPLEPGQPVLARVEVLPFGHVVRAGSRLRIWIEAPTALPQLWAFAASPVPTAVTVLHDAAHPSRLVLPLVPNDDERAAERPACDSVIRQPCRPDPLGAG